MPSPSRTETPARRHARPAHLGRSWSSQGVPGSVVGDADEVHAAAPAELQVVLRGLRVARAGALGEWMRQRHGASLPDQGARSLAYLGGDVVERAELVGLAPPSPVGEPDT